MIDRLCSLLKMKIPERNRGLLFASGTVVPTDETDGYQTGCIFQKTDGSGGTSLFVNEGSVTECDFNNIDAGSFDQGVTIGAFSSVTAGSGIAVGSDASGLIVYGDDNGLVFGDSIYNARFRLLLTVDQADSTARAMGAQLKLAAGVDVETGIYTANQGYLELVGTHVAKTGANLSCVSASLEIGTSLTIDVGGEACGIHVETTGAGTITNNGTCAGILIDKAAGAADWPTGVTVLNSTIGVKITGAATYAIDIATSGVVRMGVQDTGVDLTTAYPFAVDVQCEANADIVAGATGSTAGVYVRYAIETDQTSNTAHIAMFGKLRVKKDLADGNHAGVMGWLEISGVGTVIGGIATTTTAAGNFAVIADSNFELSTGHLNGVLVDCSVDDSATITGTLAGIRLKKSAGCYAWATGLQFEADSATSCIDIACATTPNTARTNHALVIGGRSTDELTVTFAGGAGAEHFEPVTMNFDFVGTNPASTSTVNVWQGAMTLDTDALANVRLKWSDLLTTVTKNCTDVYIHQGEIVLGGTTTISNGVACIGLVLDGGAGTITCTSYHGLNITMRGSGTPANADAIFINAVAGVTIASAMDIQADGTITTGIVFDCVPGSGTITNLLSCEITNGPAVATVEAGDANGGSIKILVDGSAKYLHYWNSAS